MGVEKATLRLGGTTLFERLVDTLRPRFERFIVSVAHAGASDELVAAVDRVVGRVEHVEIVPDQRDDQGPLAALEATLPRLRGEAAFFVAVDTAHVDPHLVERLVAAAKPADVLGAVSRHDGRIHGTFAIYETALLPIVRHRLMSGERRFGALADLEEIAVVDVDKAVGKEVFAALNTPQEFDLFRTRSEE